MKKLYTIYAFTAFIAVIILSSVSYDTVSYSTGPPAGRCGAPADGGATCTACHSSFPIIDLGNNNGWITSNIPAGGYAPGATYTITATASQNGINKFGFQMSPQATNGTYLGTMVVTNSTETQIVSTKYIEHTSAGTSGTNSKTWSFNWVAPAAGTGAVTFYACFNAANGINGSSGDQIYKTTYTINECVVSASILAPITSICSNDVAVLTAQGTGTYQWSNGATTQTIGATTGGDYTVTVTNGAGCTAVSNPVNIEVIQIPNSPEVSSPVVVCADVPATFTIIDYNSSYNYMWSLDGGTITGQSNGSYTIVWNNTGSVNLNVAATIDNCGSLPTPLSIQVDTAPLISVTGIPTTTCAGNCFPFTVSGASSITVNGVNANSGDSLCATGNGTYDIIAISSEGCSDSSNFQFDIENGPTASLIQTSSTICISDTSGINTWIWLLDGTEIGANTECINTTESGNYTVVMTGANGCTSSVSEFFTFIGFDQIPASTFYFNNPVTDQLRLLNNPEGTLIITDLNGRVIETIIIGKDARINLSNLTSGMYIVQLMAADKSYNFRLLKQAQ